MKFSLQTSAARLLGLVNGVVGVASKSSSLPILENVLLRSDSGGVMRAVCTDLEIEIESTADIGPYTGSIDLTINARKLTDILGTLPGDSDVELSSKKGADVVMKVPAGTFKFASLPGIDFPRMVVKELTTPVAPVGVAQGVLKQLIESTSFVMPTRDVRYYLVATQFLIDENKLRLCTTDGHRLALDQVSMDTGAKSKVVMLVPRKSVLELKKLIRNSTDLVQIEFFDNQARFSFDNLTFSTKLVDGMYPDIDRVVPTRNTDIVSVKRADLQLALQRVSFFSTEKNTGVLLRISSTHSIGPQMAVSLVNASQEAVDLTVPIEYTGQPIEVGYQIRYLSEVLSSIDGETVQFALSAKNEGPCLVTYEGKEQMKYVVMPMKM